MMQLRKCHVLDVKYNASVTVATSIMTQFEKGYLTQTSIALSWRELLFAPRWISVNFNCRHVINGTLFLERTLFLYPNQTGFILDGILPAIECNFILKAVYNLASIDNGIHISCKTLPYSKRIMMFVVVYDAHTPNGVLITVVYVCNYFIVFIHL